MNVFFGVLGFMGALLVLALAAFGAISLVGLLTGRHDERRRLDNQARQAEWQIAELGRQAQLAILNAALSRASGRHGTDPAGRPGQPT